MADSARARTRRRACASSCCSALDPAGGAADLGCGLGTLAIAAARLGWAPVVAVDRMEGALDAARANGARNGVAVDWRVADLETVHVPLAELLLVNAPPPVHARVAGCARARRSPAARGEGPASHVIVSGVVPTELDEVAEGYEASGWAVTTRSRRTAGPRRGWGRAGA